MTPKEKAEELFKQKELIQPISKIEAIDLMEQYAQAKVLEALEREVQNSWVESVKESFSQEGRVCDNEFLGLAKNDAVKYYETEVKPKYK